MLEISDIRAAILGYCYLNDLGHLGVIDRRANEALEKEVCKAKDSVFQLIDEYARVEEYDSHIELEFLLPGPTSP